MTRRLLGTGLFLTHFVALYHFLFSDSEGVLTDALLHKTQVCWPFMPFCRELRPFFAASADALCFALAALAIFGLVALWWPRLQRFVLPLIWMSLAIKIFIQVQDFSLMGNFHTLTLLAWLAYALESRTVWSLRFLLVAFYFAAGTLKIDREWLSGSVLHSFISAFRPEWLKQSTLLTFLPFLAAWNLILEMFVSFFLLSAHRGLFALGLLLMISFHLLSWPIVGFTFPATMLCVLLPLCNLLRSEEWQAQNHAVPAFRQWRGWWPALLVVLLQLPSQLLSSDAALSGEGRFWSINMLDSHPKCAPFYIFEKADREWFDISGLRSEMGPRLQCDPLVISEVMTSYCQQWRSEDSQTKGHAALFSRRSHQHDAVKVFSITDYCDKKIHFHPFLGNDWIEL
jgi:hypothetical protein